MSTDPQHFHDQFAVLKARYLANMLEYRALLETMLQECRAGPPSETLLLQLRDRAHKLKGTGKTYGFPAISETADIVERTIDETPTDHDKLISSLQLLITILRDTGETAVQVTSLPPTKATDSLPQPTILLVDDDQWVREAVTSLLQERAKVITAENGKEALSLISNLHPDLVILDDQMPEMTGMEVLEQLQQRDPAHKCQIIMLTASTKASQVVHAVAAGAVEYISKPFEPEMLLKKVEMLLTRQHITVLIADDDPHIGELLTHKFKKEGLHTLLAEDGEKALALARTALPQLIILDRMMPGIEGTALLRILRSEEKTKAIPVLFLTAKHSEKDILQGFKLGADDYIAKPFIPEEVVARSLRLLRLSERG